VPKSSSAMRTPSACSSLSTSTARALSNTAVSVTSTVRHALGRPLAAHDDDEAAKRDVDLRRALDVEASHDRATEFVHIPAGGRLRVFSDEMNVVEAERSIRHDGSPLNERV